MTTVRIPGMLLASYDPDTGETELVFTPAASDAGYFGPAAEVFEDDDDDFDVLDVESTDGPFWRSVQARLAAPGGAQKIDWQE